MGELTIQPQKSMAVDSENPKHSKNPEAEKGKQSKQTINLCKMKNQIYLFLIALLISGSSMAQNQWDHWIFGNNAAVNFTANSTVLPTVCS